MERNRDSRIATTSAVNGPSRRRRRVTNRRDSNEEDKEMELQETARFRDRERLQKKDRDRESRKRRRLESYAQQQRSGGENYRENDSTDASDEEYCEDEEDARIHYFNRINRSSPLPSSLSNNRRSLRTLQSSPVLKASVDETIGVPIPRRARSTSTKRLQEYDNSSGGRLGEDLGRRTFSPSPVTANVIGGGGASPSSGFSMKKIMKSGKPKTRDLNSSYNSRLPSAIQDDIEIEVVEALFDLMKQSQSTPQFSERTGDEELKKGGKDENDAFSVQCGKSIKVDAEAIMNDSIKVLKKEEKIEKEKFPNDSAVVIGDGFLNVEKVVSPNRKESKPPSCVLNALDAHDPTVTKADYATVVVEPMKEAKLEIDLMGPPPLPATPEFMAQDVQRRSETISRNGPLAVGNQPQEQKIAGSSSNQLQNLDLENFHHNLSGKQLQQGQKEQKNPLQTSLLPFEISMSGWPGVLPHTGYTPPMPVVLPVDGNARFPTAIQPPKFKFSLPRPKRSATQQFIAKNIHCYQQLITKSLWSGSTGAATLYGTMPLNPNPMQRLIPRNPSLGDNQREHNLATISSGNGKDKSSEVPAATKAAKNKEIMLQKATLQAPANNFLHAPAFFLPLGQHQTAVMAPAKLSGPPQSASASANISLPTNSAGGPSASLPLPVEAAALRYNSPNFPSNEVAPYMAMLQNNGLQFPLSASISTSQMRGTQSPPIPIFNSSFYSSPMFSVSQIQNLSALSHVSGQSGTKISDNNFPTLATAYSQQAEKQSSGKSNEDVGKKGSASLVDALAPHSVMPNNGLNYSFPVQPMNFGTIRTGFMGSTGAVGNSHLSSKDKLEFIPPAFAMTFDSNASQGPAINFTSMAQNSAIFQMRPEMIWNGYPMVKQRGFQTSEGQSAVVSTRIDDGLKGYSGKSQTRGGQSSNFCKSSGTDASSTPKIESSKVDGSASSLSRAQSASTGKQQPYLSSSVSHTSGVTGVLPHLHQHQQQSIQLQKHYILQMQQPGPVKVNASNANGMPSSFFPGAFPSDHPSLSQASIQPDNSSNFRNRQSLPRTAPKGSSESPNSIVVNDPHLKSSQGETHTPFHEQPQQTDSSPNGPNQKASPACRRNVPSILSSCPGQLSELKY